MADIKNVASIYQLATLKSEWNSHSEGITQ